MRVISYKCCEPIVRLVRSTLPSRYYGTFGAALIIKFCRWRAILSVHLDKLQQPSFTFFRFVLFLCLPGQAAAAYQSRGPWGLQRSNFRSVGRCVGKPRKKIHWDVLGLEWIDMNGFSSDSRPAALSSAKNWRHCWLSPSSEALVACAVIGRNCQGQLASIIGPVAGCSFPIDVQLCTLWWLFPHTQSW